MRLRQFILASIFGLACANGLVAQAALGFSNLDGFPDVVTQGSHYNVSGWIVNNGTVPLSGTVRIEMAVNQGSILSIDNNFNLSPALAPGDSVLWSKSNHNFPSGQFRMGHNDVLIWPTMPVFPNSEVDSLGKPVIFTNTSALKLLAESFTIFDEGVDLDREYSFHPVAHNLSDSENAQEVNLYVEIPNRTPKIIASTSRKIQPGEDYTFEVDELEISDLFHLEHRQKPSKVTFYVLEKESNDPVNELEFTVQGVVATQTIEASDLISIFPNPSFGTVQIVMPESWKADANLSVYSLQGQQVFFAAKASQSLVLPQLGVGNYLFVLQSSKGAHQQIVQFR